LGLPTWIGNYNGIGGVIDDDSIVDVVVDDIVWRWRNVFWRVDPDRYRNIHRNRKIYAYTGGGGGAKSMK